MKIAITGATGFVGTNLLDYLKASYILEPLRARYIPNQQFEIKSYALIHLAGKAHDLKLVSKPEDYYNSNFELTKQLFDAFLVSEAKVFIFMSTVKAVADSVSGILEETHLPNPKTHYGIAKHQAENYILSQKLPDGKRIYILRPCMIHGPGNKGNLNLLHKFVQKSIPYPLAAFDNKRSFLSVENLCFVVANLLGKDIPSGIYNVADDEILSTNEVVEILANSLKKKSRLWAIPPNFIRILAKFGDLLKLPLNTERLNKLTENYIVSNKKIKEAINSPLPITARNGLLKTADSFNG